MKLLIPSPILARILEHCRLEVPREAVGLLGASRDGGVVEGRPGVGLGDLTVQAVADVHNRSATPEVAFFVDPHEQWRVESTLEAAGLWCIGSYHSHPTKDAQPSGMDCEFMGDRIMLIVSMDGDARAAHNRGGPPAFRAWRAADGHTEEVELEIFQPEAVTA